MFLREHIQESEIHSLIQDLRAQHEADQRNGLNPPGWMDHPEEAQLRSCVAYGQWLIVRDSKCHPLKSLQGRIWQEGFATGELRGEVFPDVPMAFERWKRHKKIICIYSSGSVLAQQNLFRTVASGDLTPHISVFFDTRVGPKTDAESYKKIADSFSHAPEQFLFISDAVKEIAAARSIGMRVLLCVREKHPTPMTSPDNVIHDFSAVCLE